MATRACIASPAYSSSSYVPTTMSRMRRPSAGSLYGGNASSVTRDYSTTTRPPSGSGYVSSYRDTYKDRESTTYGTTSLGRNTSTYGTTTTSRIPPTGRTTYESKFGTPRYGASVSTRSTSPPPYRKNSAGTRAHTLSPTPLRPLPPGPGPLDENDRRMTRSESLRRLSNGTRDTSTVRTTGPVRATYVASMNASNNGNSNGISYNSTPPTGSLGRSRRTGSVTDLSGGNEAGASSSSLAGGASSSFRSSRRFGSQANLSKPSTPDGTSDTEQLYESNRSPVTSSYFSTNTRTYDYKDNDVLPSISSRRRSQSQDVGGTPRTVVSDRDSPATPTDRRTSVVSSRAGSTESQSPIRSSPDGITDSCGLVGLKNLGNTCFMNCILQCLSNTRPLLEYCLKEEFSDEINRSTSKMKGALMTAYGKLAKSMWKNKTESAVNPTDLKAQIQKHASRFMGYNQQDAQEFLIYLLEGLHEDVNRVTKRGKYIIDSSDEEEKISASEKARQCWKNYLQRDNSKIVDIFVGQLKSALKCQTCGYTSNTFDTFWDMALPLKKTRGYGGEVSLTDCFDLFTAEEVLEGDESPKCARCKARRKCTKSFSVQKFPKILILHLKRFAEGSYIRSKLSTLVDYPLRDLDLSKYAAEKSGCPAQYSLFAVANHSGTPFSGHYTAYAKHPYSGEWHYYNDSRVSSAASSRVKSAEGYVLFYELSTQISRL